MQKRTLKILSLAVATSFTLFSCGGNEQVEQTPETEVAEETKVEVDDMASDISYALPSPLQIAHLFKNAGLTYIGDITNSTENIDKYNAKNNQKLNFGIYSADMAYCIMNNQTQESVKYLATLKELSEKLWMTDILNVMGLSTRLEGNVGNEDSLTYIMADMQMKMDDYLDENGMGYTGSIIFAGAWIETMYIGVEVNNAESNEKLIYRLTEQSVILDNLINAMKASEEAADHSELITDLEGVNKHFDGLRASDDENYVLPAEAIEGLSNDITALRNKIING